MEGAVSVAGSVVFAILVFVVNLPLAFLIPSTSGHATLAMPIMAPWGDFAGLPVTGDHGLGRGFRRPRTRADLEIRWAGSARPDYHPRHDQLDPRPVAVPDAPGGGPAAARPKGSRRTTFVITAFLAGLVAGYGIAIPVGAVAAYLITLGAAHGFPTAAAGGLGAASVDALYAGVAVALGALLAPLIMTVAVPLRWLSAL